jgi:hypothetical protein
MLLEITARETWHQLPQQHPVWQRRPGSHGTQETPVMWRSRCWFLKYSTPTPTATSIWGIRLIRVQNAVWSLSHRRLMIVDYIDSWIQDHLFKDPFDQEVLSKISLFGSAGARNLVTPSTDVSGAPKKSTDMCQHCPKTRIQTCLQCCDRDKT